jgi:hypothetical protein
MSYTFKTRKKKSSRNNLLPGSIGDMSFRLLNLRAAINENKVEDTVAIREASLELDRELQSWSSSDLPNWKYTEIDAGTDPLGLCFNGKSHVYRDFRAVEAWNYWRTLRILVNQIILQNETSSIVPDSDLEASSLSIIRQLSIDICVSTASFTDTPRK